MSARPELATTRRLAWLYAPEPQRAALAALYTLESEIGASLDPHLDHQVAHTRLAWWREECERCRAGQAQHPVTRELAALVGAVPAALAGLAGLVDTALWDLAAATFGTRRELSAYCQRWSAALFEPLARLALPAADPDHCRALGGALRELELLTALAAEARHGRLRLPLDELAQAQAAPEELSRPPWAEALAALVRARHRQLRAELAAGIRTLAPREQAPMRGLLVWLALSCGHSRRAEHALPRASAAREHHTRLDGWRAWRAARRADAGRLVLDG
jgi:phytoene/squalene synthetase